MSQLEWTQTNQTISHDIISRIERGFGVKFPKDYIGLAEKYHGGYPNFDVFDVFDVGDVEFPFNTLLSYNPEDYSYIEDVYQRIRDRLVDHVYPFANDDFGNFICFDYRKNRDTPTISFWDHEDAFLNKEKGVSHICDSFSEFLSKLRPYEE